ncbi:MAG: hypothetical protein R3A45_02995 [Bdellovibrionota bacterium]
MAVQSLEKCGTDTFTVVLDVQPSSDVVIDVSSADTGAGDFKQRTYLT